MRTIGWEWLPSLLWYFFRKCYSELTWSQIAAIFKVLFQQLQDNLTKAFEIHLTIEDFVGIDQHKCQACSSKNIAPRHLTHYCMLLILSYKPSFWIQPSADGKCFAAIYLSFYLSMCMKFIQYLYTFLQEPVKFWWGSMLFFVKVYSRKMLLFSIFHETFVPVNGKNYSWR